MAPCQEEKSKQYAINIKLNSRRLQVCIQLLYARWHPETEAYFTVRLHFILFY